MGWRHIKQVPKLHQPSFYSKETIEMVSCQGLSISVWKLFDKHLSQPLLVLFEIWCLWLVIPQEAACKPAAFGRIHILALALLSWQRGSDLIFILHNLMAYVRMSTTSDKSYDVRDDPWALVNHALSNS